MDTQNTPALSENEQQRRNLRAKTRGILQVLRQRAIEENPHNRDRERLQEIVFCDPRKGYLNGLYVDRLVLFLRGSGCRLAKQTGGCTFCGFWDVTTFGNRIEDEDYRLQVEKVINHKEQNFSAYPVICLYNDGSMLDETEISMSVVKELCRMITERDHVKRVVIEAKITDINEEKVQQLREAAGDKEVEIAVGFESANELVRDHCINKNFRLEQFEKSHEIMKKYKMEIIPLVMIKPPFLTEYQAIEDILETFGYLERFSLQRIDMELATVEKNTLVYELWSRGKYTPPKLWSVIEILKRKEQSGFKTPVFLSPPNYTAKAYSYALNCPSCNHQVIEKIEEYNEKQDSAVFTSLQCRCRDEWERSLKEGAAGRGFNLLDQIEALLEELPYPSLQSS